ncbi:MAG TPA: XDD3 family exosortase-dependent surface protein [Nostocaceae cyanobacterium]|nr:XDD3 family exosortase-dependent surface protein [Nostocaceae cyanobacterium]
MLVNNLAKVFLSLVSACVSFVSILAKPAQAGVFSNGWYYSIDSFTDGLEGSRVGGTLYEVYAMAMQQNPDRVTFAINTNFPLTGDFTPLALDGHVGWSDLILNFTGKSLDTASVSGELFGINWVKNGSGATELGVYKNVTAKTIAPENGMLLSDPSMRAINRWVRSNKGTPAMGDISAEDPYFNQNHLIQNVIASGTKIGDVELLNDVSNLRLDFSQFGARGNYIHAFSFARNLLPNGAFVAHTTPECDNDVIAMAGVLQPVPEPSTILSLAGLGFLLVTAKIKRQHH